VVSFKGRLAAYENVCRHIPLALDSGGGDFFTLDGRHLICATHGAIYEPLSGLCVRGPCEGASLKPLSVDVHDGFIEVTIDDRDDGDDWRHQDWH
jgi:nitrite reductase/ring-hydroxylating ferredoxin subunit